MISKRLLVALLVCLSLDLSVVAQDGGNEVAALESRRLELDVQRQKLYQPVSDLNTLYREQLEKLEDRVRKEGDLDKVLLVQKELESFAENGPAEVTSFPQLSRLQQVYKREMKKRREELERSLAPLMASYVKQLKELERRYTQNDEIEKALEVREELESVETRVKEMPVAPAPQDPAPILSRPDGEVEEGSLAGFGAGNFEDPVGETGGSYNDFIEIKVWEQNGAKDGWVALRSNGILVSHLSRRVSESRDHIVAFDCSKTGGILMVTKDGRLISDACTFQPSDEVRAKLTNVVDVVMSRRTNDAADEIAVALRADGTLVGWGPYFEKTDAIELAEEIRTGVAALYGQGGNLRVLKPDGTMLAWTFRGNNGLQSPPGDVQSEKFAELVVEGSYTLGLTLDGRVLAWGSQGDGAADVPADLGKCDRIRTIRHGLSLARRVDGTWAGWGKDYRGLREKVSEIGPALDIAGNLAPWFNYAYMVWIEG